MRKFYLENELGQRYDLQDYNKIITFSFDGLGFSFSNEYLELGTRFIKNKSKLLQKTVNCKLLVKNKEAYQEFIKFILMYDEYKLVYEIDDINYYIDVDIISVQKQDNIKDDYFIIPFELKNTSLFYKQIEKTYQLQAEENQNRWAFSLPFIWNNKTSGIIEVDNNGHIQSPFKIEIDGYCLNPKIKVTDKLGNIEEIIFNIEVKNDEKILFSTIDDDLYVYLQNKDGIKQNILSSLDFTKTNFIKISTGKNIVEIKEDITKAKLTLYEGYLTV